jgi:signal transduction histidine kinase/ligand-binding sensor domain-containing protein
MASVHYRQLRAILFLFVALLMSFAREASAADYPWTLARYQHTSWTSKDGAPAAISSLAQTADGRLWIGTGSGLYSFDGQKFSAFEPVPGETLASTGIYALLATKDGGLWIGYEADGISFLKNGHLTTYDKKSGYDAANAPAIVQTKDGTVWAASNQGLMYFRNGHWSRAEQQEGLTAERFDGAVVGPDDTLWVANSDSIFALRSGAIRFQMMAGHVAPKQILGLTLAPGGVLLERLDQVIQRYLDRGDHLEQMGKAIPVFGYGRFDRQGGLWIGDGGGGVHHIADPDNWFKQNHAPFEQAFQSFRKSDGLTDDYVWPVLEDSWGDIWLGTGAGLDRFHTRDFASAVTPSGTDSFALGAADNGKVWSGSSNRPVMLLDGDNVTVTEVPPFTMALSRGTDGVVLAAGRAGIWQLKESGSKLVAALPEEVKLGLPRTLTRDGQSTLWTVVAGRVGGFFAYRNGQWAKETTPSPVNVTYTDRAGSIWLGCADNYVGLLSRGAMTFLSASHGVNVGSVRAFAEGPHAMWVGGSDGLGYIRNGRFYPVRLDGPQRLSSITAILFARDGSLWIQSTKGVFRISSEVAQRTEDAADTPMAYRQFDVSDGLEGIPAQEIPLPSAILGTDGRLWFSTSAGVSWLNPSELSPITPVPPVTISLVAADSKVSAASSSTQLPANSHNIRFAYNALTLAQPERVRYRVRLAPIDQHWQDMGSVRGVTYASLGPGDFTFQVQARMADGAWAEPGSALSFSVIPAFYQRYWFYALCAIIGAALLWLFYRRQLRLAAERDQIRFNERLWERERIARDLHDTLLQDVQTLVLDLGNIDLPSQTTAASREKLSDATRLAKNALLAARGSVQHLRKSDAPDIELLSSIKETIDHMMRHYSTPCHVSTTGLERRLHPSVSGEVIAVAREAILNSLKHAHATRIDVVIEYGVKAFRLRVIDDGVGVDQETISERQREGHWGILGMQERAKTIGGDLKFSNHRDGGVEILFIVSAVLGYQAK